MRIDHLKVQAMTALVAAGLLVVLLPVAVWAQADSASIDGTVLDASGATVPDAQLQLTSVETGVVRNTQSGPDGLFSFQTLRPGDYALAVTATGFRVLERSGISLRPNQRARLNLELEVGAVTETVTVSAAVAQLNFENATQETGVGPNVLNQLPLVVSGGVRNVTQFALLIPGVNAGGTGNNPFDARVNGGMQGGDEAVFDGATTSGVGGNLGFINFSDMRISPDMVSEFKLITANYEPHWGGSTSSQIVVNSRSGTSEYHGAVFYYHRNTQLNARPWNASFRPPDIEHDAGGFIGGPILQKANHKLFGFFMTESFRAAGGVNLPTLSIPSLKQRVGDFTDWTDSSGSIIPVYDPASTRSDGQGGFARDQFNCMGVPNVICPSRISNSLANQWFQHLPQPTSPGPLNNFVPPKPKPGAAGKHDYKLYKGDYYLADKDHFSVSLYDDDQPGDLTTFLPPILERQLLAQSFKNIFRVNWDHTFSPTIINTFNLGWTHANFTEGVPDAQEKANQLPQIPGVESHESPPTIHFAEGFPDFTHPGGPLVKFTGDTNVYNNLTTIVKGRHTFKFGGEYWSFQNESPIQRQAYGEFWFRPISTGLIGENSGSSVASFLLEAVDEAQSLFRTVDLIGKRRDSYMAHFGDTWKVTSNLTLNMGVRWDMHRPAIEKNNISSFLDPTRPNPGAGGRLGALAFAGDEFGDASFGSRYPEHLFKKGFAPRLGIAYGINDKTVIRAGYGIFFSQAFYPGWDGGIMSDGFNTTASFGSTQGGLTPAMILSEGFPQNFTRPPFIDSTFRNGQSIYYRDFNGNQLPYSQQWSLTIERQLDEETSLSMSYNANKGNRLFSVLNPINVLDPSLRSMGASVLRDEFQPGMTSLHGVPLPYDGWTEQLGCAPSVAQALLPYPQFCGTLEKTNENAAQSTYHSFQLKAERNIASGTYLLLSYTLSKMLTNGGSVNSSRGGTWSGMNGAFSPFEQHREKSIANDDVPHNLTVAWVYEMPFGPGKRFQSDSGALNKVVGGWVVSGFYRAVSGTPWLVRSGNCNTIGQFRASCVPAMLDGANPYAQSKGNFDPANGPLFSSSAFEPGSAFNEFGYWGSGPRILPNVRQFGIQNWDLSIYKNTPLTERVNLQLRFEFFNIFNMHYFAGSTVWGGSPFTQNLSSPNFGSWNGSVTSPRNIQIGARIEF